MNSKWPIYAEDEIAVATEVLRSGKVNYWTGEHGKLFEKEYADYLGMPYTVAVSNGTVAIELCLRALGIGAGDEVIVPAKTFIATASAVVAMGATPIIADVDIDSQNITAEAIIPHISSKTKAIIVVHLSGWPCEMKSILALAKKNNLFVIEDCAQAHGAMLNGKPVGSFGDMAAFSFCQDKIITTAGEGGLVVCSNEAQWKTVWSYKDHGKDYDVVFNRKHPPGFRWLHEDFGSNYRMTEIQAAIGRVQLKKLASWTKIRQQYAKIYEDYFCDLSAVRLIHPPQEFWHAYYRYDLFIKPDVLKHGWSRNRILEHANQLGVPCVTGKNSEIYLEQAFVKNNLKPAKRLPIAQVLSETSIALLVDPVFTEGDIHATAKIMYEVIGEASQ